MLPQIRRKMFTYFMQYKQMMDYDDPFTQYVVLLLDAGGK